jgi:hypothetical protein
VKSFLKKSALCSASCLQALSVTGLAVGAIAISAPAVAQDVSASSLTGTVTDNAGNAVGGASIVVTSQDRGFSRTATTSAGGSFTISGLPVGTYDVMITGDGIAPTRIEGVAVAIGGSNYSFSAEAPSADGSEIVVLGTATRTVDFSGTATGVVFDVQNIVETVPVPRNIEAIQLLTPQVTSGDSAFGGVSIGGSSVAENIYYINGMNITNFRTFVGGTTVPFEFYDQVQVKTGGYQAEFGRNTGGAVIALTRSGSNELQGGLNIYWAPNDLRQTSPNTFAQQNEFDEREQLEGNFWASGPVIKDRLFFFGFYNPRKFTQSDTADNGDVTTRKIDSPFYGGKLDLNIIDGHRVEATYFSDDQDEYVELNGSPTTFFSGGENYIFKYTGAMTDWFTLSALYGKSKFNQTTQGADDLVPYVLDGRTNPALDYIAGNPAGVIDIGDDTRENYRVDADFFFDAFGEHHVRMGWDRENLTAVNATIYSGGTYYRYYRSGAAGALGGLIAPNTDYVRVRELTSGGEFESINTAWYIQDSWDVTDRINLSLGVRNDTFENRDGLGETFTKLKNLWQPRLGINFDPIGDRRARLSAFYGRFYLPVAANTNIRLAGSEEFYQDWYTLPVGPGGVYNGDLVNPDLGTLVQADVLSPGGVAPPTTLRSKNLEPQYLDEFIVGGEYTFDNRMRVSANVTYRTLGAVLEDVDFDGSGNYYSIVDAFCATQTQAWCNPMVSPTVGSGGYVLINPGADLIVDAQDDNGDLHELVIPNSFFGLPEAERDYWSAEFKWERPFDGTWGALASYVWSESKGNYEGGVKSDNGQDDTGLTQDFDEIGWMDGANGYLPNHRRHTFKVFGNYAPNDRWNIGVNAILQSPRKFGCQGTYPIIDFPDGTSRATRNLASSWYCNAQIELGNVDGTLNEPVGRGSVFNSDWNKRIDLQIAYNMPIVGDSSVRFSVEVFNLLNFKSKLDFNEFGDKDDPDNPNENYMLPTVYQTPRYVRFGASFRF